MSDCLYYREDGVIQLIASVQLGVTPSAIAGLNMLVVDEKPENPQNWKVVSGALVAVPTEVITARTAAKNVEIQKMELLRSIRAQEAIQARPLREVLVAVTAGQTPNSESVSKLTAINSEISTLRSQFNAL